MKKLFCPSMGLMRWLSALVISLCGPVFAQPTASPNPCVLGASGTCTSTISYSVPGYPGAGLLLQETMQWPVYGPSGSYTAPWINQSGYTFAVHAVYGDPNSPRLGEVRVSGVYPAGTITPSPNPCTITSGTCTSTLTYQTSNAPGAGLLLRETQQWAAYGSGGQYVASYINTQGYNFDLYEVYGNTGSRLLDSKYVFGTVASSNSLPYGWLDNANSEYAHGWSCDPDTFGAPLAIEIRDAGGVIGRTTANSYRPDLANPCGGNAYHAYTMYWSQAERNVRDNQNHQISAYAQDAQTGQWVLLSGSPQTIFIPSVQRPPFSAGAIRWDGWFGAMGTGVGNDGWKTNLNKTKYLYRQPFFTQKNPFDIRSDSQVVMDREIDLASSAGLNYWAFLYYNGTFAPQYNSSLPLYRQSAKRGQINFALILQSEGVNASNWAATVSEICGMLQEPGYQLAIDGRPLVYVYRAKDFTGDLNHFRDNCKRAGKAPYIVGMDWWAHEVNQTAVRSKGFDAFSSYSNYSNDTSSKDQPSSSLLAGNQRFWNDARGFGMRVIPTVSAGWDPSPRTDPGGFGNIPPYLSATYAWATPQEVGAAVGSAKSWASHPDNVSAAEANSILIYAWNEFDEGGWIAPTLQEGNARLQEIGKALTGSAPAPMFRADEMFTDQFYRALLGRAPDDGGYAYWLGRIRGVRCAAGDLRGELNVITPSFIYQALREIEWVIFGHLRGPAACT